MLQTLRNLPLILLLGASATWGFDYSPGLSAVPYPFPSTPMPEIGKPYREPLFNTTVTRITDVRNGSFPARLKGLTNEYSRYDPVNADGSLLLLRGTDGSWYLYDLRSSRLGGKLFDRRGDFEPRWHGTDPDLLFFVTGSRFYRYDVRRGIKSLIHDFKTTYPTASFIRSGKGESSRDSRYRAFMVVQYDNRKPAGQRRTLLDMVTFDTEEKRVVGSYRKMVGRVPATIPRTVTVSMSGRYVLVEYIPEIRIYDLQWRGERVFPGSFGHGDLALDRRGREVFVAQETATDHITMVDLATLKRTDIMEIPFRHPRLGGVSYPGFHVSGNSLETPGWVLVSTYGGAERPSFWSDGAIFLLELVRNGRHWRVAHTRSRTMRGKGKDYWAEAFASIDRSGRRVFWPSNWGVSEPGYVDLYQVSLPGSWYSDLGKGR
ncbi:MAG TPA: hypothetical protein ENJ43_05500 [Gammaproteobacteria bacterium]|nr:hypothetical protein [Gammaproteobacteria bacterium]